MLTDQKEILIGDVCPFSIVDFPDHISAVLFLQGCPWRCPFCYNTSLQPFKKTEGGIWTFEKFYQFVKRRFGVLDAVVFSGGEPLMQKNLPQAVKQIKDLGYTVGLHTGGYHPARFKELLAFLDWVGFDIKGPKEKYKLLTGGFDDFEAVEESLKMLIDSGISFECRTTCDPRLLNAKDLLQIGTFLKQAGVKEYHLQKYRPVESDKTTSDSSCEALISDPEVLDFMRSSFEKFDVRK